MIARVHQTAVVYGAGRSDRSDLGRGVDDWSLYGKPTRRWTRLLWRFDDVLLVGRLVRTGLRLLLLLLLVLLLLLLHLLLHVATAARWRSCHQMRLLLLLLLLQTRMRTSGRWRRRVARCFGADRRRYGSSAVTWCLRGVHLQRFILEHKRSSHAMGSVSVTMTATSSVPASNWRRLIVVVRPSVMHVVMPPANHSVTNYMVTWVMILDATSGDPTGTTRTPLVAAVRIVKQRVLVRLRIRVKVVVDLGLHLLGDDRYCRCSTDRTAPCCRSCC